ncbi:hypothetical protein PAV_14c00460 [Paenibacillus alvei DSM 29]|nr:hypothetical protein PAV_14c00460 [Paenibacillus alvei DSM 29]
MKKEMEAMKRMAGLGRTLRLMQERKNKKIVFRQLKLAEKHQTKLLTLFYVYLVTLMGK